MALEVAQRPVSPLRLPWITCALAVACAVMLGVSETDTRLETTSFVAWGVVPGDFVPVSTLTHVFFHAHLAHLLGGLALLLVIGTALESQWSALLVAPLVAAGAAASGGVYAWRTPDSTIPMVGLAGVVASMLGASLVRFRQGMPFTWYQRAPSGLRAMQLTLPVVVLLPLWFVGEIAGSIGHFNGVTRGINYWGQLGGLLTGALVAGLVEWTGLERRLFGAPALRRAQDPNPAIESALLARENGNLNEALGILADAVAGGAGDPELIVHYWEMASFAGKPQQAAADLLRLIEKELASGDRQHAADHWCELIQRVRQVEASPRLLIQLVPLLSALDHGREALQTLRLAACSPELGPGMALRVVDLASPSDPASALRAARIALTSAELHEAKRSRLQELVSDLSARGVHEAEIGEAEEEEDRSLELAEDDFQPPVIAPERRLEVPEEGFALSADGSLVEGEIGRDLSSGGFADSAAERARIAPPAPVAQPPVRSDAHGGAPAASNREDMSVTTGLAYHGLDLEAAETEAVATLVDATPSTQVETDLVDPGTGSSYSAEDDDDMEPIEEPLRVFDAIALEASCDEPRFSDAKIVDAIPTELGPARLGLQQPGGRRGHVDFAKVDAISVVAVRGLADKPVVLLDLLANWTSLEGGLLQLVRLRSDQFDARTLVPDAPDSVEAFKMLAQILLEQCAAVALPDPRAAIGQPFRVCERLSDYEREILQLDR